VHRLAAIRFWDPNSARPKMQEKWPLNFDNFPGIIELPLPFLSREGT
jgi:hypothetical protein